MRAELCRSCERSGTCAAQKQIHVICLFRRGVGALEATRESLDEAATTGCPNIKDLRLRVWQTVNQPK